MTDFNIATGEEQPLNRTGIDNVQVTGENQGVPVGIDNSVDPPQLVRADAAADANDAGNGPVQAVGVLFPREVMPADLSNVTQHPWDHVEEGIYREERTLAGDRATVVRSGIEMVNDDDDTDFTPGEPVYLDVGGGFTQTEPSTSGEAVQVLGVACTTMDDGVNPQNVSKDRIFLEVDADYHTVA
jgi:predicted RecA/RadA family phage recombinase